MARFKQVNLAVHKMDETLDFYRRLGIDIPDDKVWRTHSGAHHASDATGGLEFDSHKLSKLYNEGFAAERGRVTIGVELDSREAVDVLWTQLLEGGVQGLQPPFDAPWGERFAIVEDPDGNPVAIASPVDPSMRGAPYDI
ncbi:MAG TPA: VOC family protein [Caulobacteraceae bacterium]|jgi:catechol 2,3-dioxygenase-like lactoylglutathione lyase family enzyme